MPSPIIFRVSLCQFNQRSPVKKFDFVHIFFFSVQIQTYKVMKANILNVTDVYLLSNPLFFRVKINWKDGSIIIVYLHRNW